MLSTDPFAQSYEAPSADVAFSNGYFGPDTLADFSVTGDISYPMPDVGMNSQPLGFNHDGSRPWCDNGGILPLHANDDTDMLDPGVSGSTFAHMESSQPLVQQLSLQSIHQSMHFLPGVQGHVPAASLMDPYAFLARVPVPEIPVSDVSDIDMTCERPADPQPTEWDFVRGRSPTRSPSPPGRSKNRSSHSAHSCKSCDSTFGRSDTLLRHEREYHGPETPKFTCGGRQWGCGRGFTRLSSLKHHQHNTRKGQQCMEQFRIYQDDMEQRRPQLESTDAAVLTQNNALPSQRRKDGEEVTPCETTLPVDHDDHITLVNTHQEPSNPQPEALPKCFFCNKFAVFSTHGTIEHNSDGSAKICLPPGFTDAEPPVLRIGKALRNVVQAFHMLFENAIGDSCTQCSKQWRLDEMDRELRLDMLFAARARIGVERGMS